MNDAVQGVLTVGNTDRDVVESCCFLDWLGAPLGGALPHSEADIGKHYQGPASVRTANLNTHRV
ncbi:hypothetical protein [Nocardiopsis sp. YSL2]|uniref:hypothetical protein n=1 Tax=Nocardiopsis sp. YSL2 TaxID=2939492 RepID=UPI0026F46D0E|nr:hypothetical protein [Nocardiopsis sp. YSL2]